MGNHHITGTGPDVVDGNDDQPRSFPQSLMVHDFQPGEPGPAVVVREGVGPGSPYPVHDLVRFIGRSDAVLDALPVQHVDQVRIPPQPQHGIRGVRIADHGAA